MALWTVVVLYTVDIIPAVVFPYLGISGKDFSSFWVRTPHEFITWMIYTGSLEMSKTRDKEACLL